MAHPADSRLADEWKANRGDPWWRLNHLYRLVDDDGKEFVFKANPEQAQFYSSLWLRNLVLKARQLGFTTFIDLILLDQCLFNQNFTAGIIAHTLDDAGKIFRNKIQYPYEHLPALIREAIPLRKESASEYLFANGSGISVSTSMRSGTLQALHVSEFGKICKKTPEKAKEIVTGSFETLTADGFLFVESTAEGAEGYFFDYCDAAMKRQDEGLRESKLDFRLHFFPWFKKDAYALDDDSCVVDAQMRKYFDKIEGEAGIELTPAQKAWYVKKKETLKGDMGREYPSTPKEAFEQTIEGAIYGDEMTWLRKNGRITSVPIDPAYPVNTFWDLGTNDTTAIWLHQRIGLDDRFSWYLEEAGQGMAYFWNCLKELQAEHKFVWDTHHLPHDADNDLQGEVVETRVDILNRLGMRSIQTVPRVADINVGIDLTRTSLRTAAFDRENCAQGIKALDNYQRQWDERNGRWRDKPLHNWASNGADAIRQWAQGFKAPSLAEKERRGRRERNWRVA